MASLQDLVGTVNLARVWQQVGDSLRQLHDEFDGLSRDSSGYETLYHELLNLAEVVRLLIIIDNPAIGSTCNRG